MVVDASGVEISPGARETSEAQRRPNTVATNAATTPEASADCPNGVTASAPKAMTCGSPATATDAPPENAPTTPARLSMLFLIATTWPPV